MEIAYKILPSSEGDFGFLLGEQDREKQVMGCCKVALDTKGSSSLVHTGSHFSFSLPSVFHLPIPSFSSPDSSWT